MSNPDAGWRRPVEGRWISGACGALARRSGLSLAAVRALVVLAFLVGALLALGAAIFDRALLGESAAAGLRAGGIVLGLAGVFFYPVLSALLPDEHRPRRWEFAGATAVLLTLVVIGELLGRWLEPYWETAKSAWIQRGPSGWLTWPGDHVAENGLQVRDLVLVVFLVSAGTCVVLAWPSVKAFFRSMHVGVTLTVLATLAVAVGVMVPQIDGFEDPDARVDLLRERADYELFREHGYQKLPAALQDGHEQYQAFRWAEGYFLYHLAHLYGIGMPEAALSPSMEASLEGFARSYGREEAKNRRKRTLSSMAGGAKIDEIGAFIYRNEESFWRFFELSTLLQLNRTYKSSWFASLLGLLAFAVLLNTFRGPARGWFRIESLGFFTVHVGLLVMLAGGLFSKLFTERGIIHLFLDEPPRDVFYRHFDQNKPARLPFALRLDHFGRKDWKALEVYFLDQDHANRPPRYTLWPGRTIELDWVEESDGRSRPRLRLEVEGLSDRARLGKLVASEATEGGEGEGPRAEIRYPEESAAAHAGHAHELRTLHRYLAPLREARQSFPGQVHRDVGGRFRLAAVHGASPEEYFPAQEGVLGRLEVQVVGEGDGAPVSLPARLDETLELPGGWGLRVVDASADFRPGAGAAGGSTNELPLAEQERGIAAVWVDVMPPDGSEVEERRVVLEGIDAREHGLQDSYAHPSVTVDLRWDDWLAPGPPRYLLHWEGNEAAILLGEDGSRSQVLPGEPLAVPGEDGAVLGELFENAAFERDIELLEPRMREDGWEPDFYARDPRGLELRVVRDPGTENERSELVRMATTNDGGANQWFPDDRRFALFYLENSEMMPFEWRSVLSVLERDPATGLLREVPLGSEREREIRVNDYLHYRGYRFFQTNAIAEMPEYSGVGVVYDPGIPWVLFGMYTIIFGSAVAFLVRPIVTARRARKEARGS